jgi:hypothetical protein
MQLLVFNTTTKSAKLYDPNGVITSLWDNVPTVKVQEGFYEVIQKDEFDKNYPVFRCPISNTNMKIEK